MIINSTSQIKVSKILNLLNLYKIQYQDNGEIPIINSTFELNLFNTFRSYMDIKNHFPVKFIKNTDPRGTFVEIIRLGIGGQVSSLQHFLELLGEIIFINVKLKDLL